MSSSPALIEYLKWWEAGVPGTNAPALVAYDDGTGVWTLGWGCTRGVKKGYTCTVEEAEHKFRAALNETFFAVEHTLGDAGKALVQHQVDALTSLAYNIGVPRFRTSSARLMVISGNISRVGPAMELWNKATDPRTGHLVVMRGLVRRRAADRAIFDKGDYSGRP